jgi:LysR family transcriptional regulator, mexEF-oprN operon transcriptional activator
MTFSEELFTSPIFCAYATLIKLNVIITIMNEMHFRGIDLNSLIVFAVLMRERSVTKTAEKLFLGQPAISHALSRLREKFSDRLFVRTRDGMVPTPRALEIDQLLAPGLAHLETAIRPTEPFDPAQSKAIIRLGLPDDLDIYLPALVKKLSLHAPHVRLVVRPTDFRAAPAQLDSADIHVALCAKPIALESWHQVEVLMRESFAAIYDAKQIGKKGTLSLKQYLKLPHILVSQNGEFHGAVDEKLKALGLFRHVMIAAARFTTLPLLLRQIPAIANVPISSVKTYAENFNLEVSSLPFESPSFDLAIINHARLSEDAVTCWFKNIIKTIVQEPARTIRSRPTSKSSQQGR